MIGPGPINTVLVTQLPQSVNEVTVAVPGYEWHVFSNLFIEGITHMVQGAPLGLVGLGVMIGRAGVEVAPEPEHEVTVSVAIPGTVVAV